VLAGFSNARGAVLLSCQLPKRRSARQEALQVGPSASEGRSEIFDVPTLGQVAEDDRFALLSKGVIQAVEKTPVTELGQGLWLAL
jgi:hypothetical protein